MKGTTTMYNVIYTDPILLREVMQQDVAAENVAALVSVLIRDVKALSIRVEHVSITADRIHNALMDRFGTRS